MAYSPREGVYPAVGSYHDRSVPADRLAAQERTQRVNETISRSSALCRWAADVRERAQIGRARQVELRVEAQVLVSRRSRYFYLRGYVGATEVMAAYTADGLAASPLLLDHAQVVVGMGDTFPDPTGSGEEVPASLTGSAMVVLLTLSRACEPYLIEIGPLTGRESWGLR